MLIGRVKILMEIGRILEAKSRNERISRKIY